MKYVKIASQGDILPGQVKSISPQRGEHILLCNVAGVYYALKDACTHDGGMLAFGELEDNLIECPRHGAKFDVRTGEAIVGPAVNSVYCYPVRVQGENIEVGLGDE